MEGLKIKKMRALLVLILLSVTLPVSMVYSATILHLERAFPLNQPIKLDEITARDGARHARLLQSSGAHVVKFPLQGISDPYLAGLYYTKVKLGSPPRVFNVQIDTGSDALWVTCSSCTNCPRASGFSVELSFFDISSSSTAKPVSCSDAACSLASKTTETQCSQSNHCSYSFKYGDGSSTSGYYVNDMFHLEAIKEDNKVVNSSDLVMFGCSTSQSGGLTKSEKAIDGIFGFGHGDLSVLSQLSSKGITPKAFSHCLKGEGSGGGILVLGEILEPGIVYSPLIPSQAHYSLNLQSIAVDGRKLPINPSVFTSSTNQGTIIDTGTTLAYLVEEAYNPFINAISAVVVPNVTPKNYKEYQCYLVPNGITGIFPSVTLNFAGGAPMVLRPEDYLVYLGFYEVAAVWCIGFRKAQEGGPTVTILGDIVLKDKIFVYDVARQRIGWTNYDCSRSVNVSASTSKDQFTDDKQHSMSTSSRHLLLKVIQLSFMALLMHLVEFMEYRLL